MSETKKKAPAKKSSANRGLRRRAILVLFRSGKFSPPEISRLFGVTVADVWGEIRKALA